MLKKNLNQKSPLNADKKRQCILASGLILSLAVSLFVMPWWGFVAVSVLFSALATQRFGRSPSVVIACATLLVWDLLVFAQDAMSGFRISLRVSHVMGLKNQLLIYLLMSFVVFGLAYLAADVGRLARVIVKGFQGKAEGR